jgi:hypothetical protein
VTALRVADAFRGDDDPPGISDGDFELTCTCGLDQRLDTTLIDDEMGEITLYDCSRCENTVAAILTERAAQHLQRAAGMMARRGAAFGTTRNGYLIGVRSDLALRPPDADTEIEVINSSPDFFDALRNLE